MNKHIKKEILVALGLVVISFFCMFTTMPPMMYVGVHIIAVILFILFAIMIWRSKAQDERESMNKALSSDIAFTAGGVMLGIAMIYQISTDGHIDIWIMVTLATMILARVVSQIWLNKNN